MSKLELLRLTTYVEDLRSVLMFHLIPLIIDTKHLKRSKTLETLNSPYDLRVKRYPMKVAVRSGRKKRYIRQVATTFQCARVLGKPASMPCNGAVYFVDKVNLSAIVSAITMRYDFLLCCLVQKLLSFVFSCKIRFCSNMFISDHSFKTWLIQRFLSAVIKIW